MTRDLRAAAVAAVLATELAVSAALVLVRSSPVTAPLAATGGGGTASAPLAPPSVGVPVLGGLRLAPRAVQPATGTAHGSATRTDRPRAAPRLRVPALDVDAPVVPLRTGGDGVLQVPGTATDVGVWAAGPEPGDPGAAVLVGHVDLDGRAGVFARLDDLRPGDVVTVQRSDGRAASFRVERLEQVRKAEFPTDAVYAPTSAPSLRLVTCGGAFDRRSGHYRDNVVVFASAL